MQLSPRSQGAFDRIQREFDRLIARVSTLLRFDRRHLRYSARLGMLASLAQKCAALFTQSLCALPPIAWVV